MPLRSASMSPMNQNNQIKMCNAGRTAGCFFKFSWQVFWRKTLVRWQAGISLTPHPGQKASTQTSKRKSCARETNWSEPSAAKNDDAFWNWTKTNVMNNLFQLSNHQFRWKRHKEIFCESKTLEILQSETGILFRLFCFCSHFCFELYMFFLAMRGLCWHMHSPEWSNKK